MRQSKRRPLEARNDDELMLFEPSLAASGEDGFVWEAVLSDFGCSLRLGVRLASIAFLSCLFFALKPEMC